MNPSALPCLMDRSTMLSVQRGQKWHAQPTPMSGAAVRATNKNGSWYLTMNATKDAVKAAPGYKYDKELGPSVSYHSNRAPSLAPVSIAAGATSNRWFGEGFLK
jgi:hypothetical protein